MTPPAPPSPSSRCAPPVPPARSPALRPAHSVVSIARPRCSRHSPAKGRCMASPAAAPKVPGVSSTRWHPARGRFWHINDLPLRLGSAVVGGLAVVGCTGQQVAGPALPPAPLPSLGLGNAYSFDDGRNERVAGTSAGGGDTPRAERVVVQEHV